MLSPEDIVDLFWSGNRAKSWMPMSIRLLQAKDEEVVETFHKWYALYRSIMQEDEQESHVKDEDPPEESVLPVLPKDYQDRIKENEKRLLERRAAFESLAARYAGRHFVYREGRCTLFLAKLLGVHTDANGVDISMQVSANGDIVFLPPAPPVCDTGPDNSMCIRLSWSFYFDEFRWSEPYLGLKMFFCDEIINDLACEAKALANLSPDERFRRLDRLLMEDVCRLDPQLVRRKKRRQAIQ